MAEWMQQLADAFSSIHEGRQAYICRNEIFQFIEDCVNILYPSRCEKLKSPQQDWLQHMAYLDKSLCGILSQMKLDKPQDLSRKFLSQLPLIKRSLDKDAHYFANEDPAAISEAEVILCYPGFFALAIHRLAHPLYSLEVPLLARIVSEYAHEKTGIDIHPGAKIDCPIFIDHGTGIVVGETCRIGHHVKIFQGVTLGAPSVKRELRGQQRHPTVGNHVILYANATILGGNTTIGDHSIIGGNVWLTSSVPEKSELYYQSNHRSKT